MTLPKAYLTTGKNLEGILNAMQTARAPQKFTQQFLAGLGFKSSSDRLVINVLKALGFLTAGGAPTQRYFEFLDQTQGGRVMAEAMLDAYSDIFEVKTDAQNLSKTELKNKMRTLSQGQFSNSVLDKMAMTFQNLAKHADFDAAAAPGEVVSEAVPTGEGEGPTDDDATEESESEDLPLDRSSPMGRSGSPGRPSVDFGGLVYNIQIQLPESRDQAVYDALFQSLRTHLLD